MADKSDKVDKPDAVENTIEKLKPLLQQVSFGGVLGYCSGYALKQLGKATAFVVGIGFLGLQTASHYGYIEVDWVKVRDDALKPLDTTGDGKFDAEDLKELYKRVRALLVNKLPSAGGFSFGFLTGLQSG